jgi:hypothetical protein
MSTRTQVRRMFGSIFLGGDVGAFIGRRPSPCGRFVAVEAFSEPFPLPLLPHPQAARLAFSLVAHRNSLGQHFISFTQPLGASIGFGVSHVITTNYTAKSNGRIWDFRLHAELTSERPIGRWYWPARRHCRPSAHVTTGPEPSRARRGRWQAMPQSCRSPAMAG